jgi:hypothetical protein
LTLLDNSVWMGFNFFNSNFKKIKSKLSRKIIQTLKKCVLDK